jgi:hypothetical protein
MSQGAHLEYLYSKLDFELLKTESWSLIFREEQELRVYKDKVIEKIQGFKNEEVTGRERI